MSLRTLINIRILLSVIFILLLGGMTAVIQARHSVAKELNSSVALVLQMIEFGVSQTPLEKRQGTAWLAGLDTLQKIRHIKISVLEDGHEALNWTHASDDTISASRPPDWFVKAAGTQSARGRYEVKLANGHRATIMVQVDPLDEITEAWGESQAFFWSIVAMLVIIYVMVNLVFHSVFQAVKSILSGLQYVESGDYQHRLPVFKIREFDMIAREIETLSDVLKTSKENNQALARHTMKIQETERQVLSRELHDEMGQSLTAIKAMAVSVRQPGQHVLEAADAIIEICDHLATVVRSMMRSLHPLSLTELGLSATLRDMVAEWQRRKPDLTFHLNVDSELDQLDHERGIHIYRIVQECLTNVVRHAKASQASVLVERRGRMICIVVSDDGMGKQGESQGFGLRGMRERVESLGGHFHFESVPGQGVTVAVQLPYGEKSDK